MKKNAENTVKTRTVNPLSLIRIRRGDEIVFETPINTPCQMWAFLKGMAPFKEYGKDVTIDVLRDDETIYMQFEVGVRKNGTEYMKQNVKTNRRAQVTKQKEAEKIAQAKRAAKNAKERARRAAKKAAAEQAQVVPAPVADEPAVAEN